MQPSSDQSATHRVTVIEAAQILGVTPDAVRSRLRRGSLQRDEAEDGTVLVVLDGGDGRNGRGDQPTGHPTDQATVAYINALKSHIASLEREVEDRKEEMRRKDHLMALQLEHMRALEPAREEPREARASPTAGSEESSGTPSPSDEEKRQKGFWRRFFGLE